MPEIFPPKICTPEINKPEIFTPEIFTPGLSALEGLWGEAGGCPGCMFARHVNEVRDSRIETRCDRVKTGPPHGLSPDTETRSKKDTVRPRLDRARVEAAAYSFGTPQVVDT